MADWAELQARLLLADAVVGEKDIREHREAITEALWQAFENGRREGELQVLRGLVAQVLDRG